MGVSGVQILIVLVVIAILFMGPSRIPQIGKSLGQAIRGFKKGLTDDEIDVTDSVKQEKLDESETQTANQQTQSEKQKS